MTVTQLTREPVSAAVARRQVLTLLRAWRLPVDPDIAVLLTSDLVTSVITAGTGRTIALAVSCSRGHLRIGASDSSWIPAVSPGTAVAGPGLALVAALSAGWGFYQSSAGPAAYFTLALQPDPGWAGGYPGGQHRRRETAAAG